MSTKAPLMAQYGSYLIGLVFGIIAFIANTFFVIDISTSVHVYLGSTLVLLSVLMLPFRIAVFVLLASLLPLILNDSPVSFAWIACAEFFTIIVLLYSGIRFLTALSIFWLFVGLPISSAIVYLSLSLNIQTSIFLALTFVLNAYICGLLALLVYWLLPASSNLRQFETPPKFSELVFELNLVSVMLPVLLVALVFTWRSTHETEVAVGIELDKAAEELDRSINELLDDKIHALKAAAKMISEEPQTQYHAKILDTVANASANIESMVVVDKNATALLAAPRRYEAMLPNLEDVNISHREYFQLTKQLKAPVVSHAIKGSGFASLDIIALTAPIIRQNEFDGLVQAAIRLDSLVDESIINSIENNHIFILVIDSQGSVVYSSNEFTFNKLDAFEQDTEARPSTFTMSEIGIAGKSYLYKERFNPKGWTIYTLTAPSRVFVSTNSYFLFIGISILLSIILIALLSKGLTAKITRPLKNLEAFIQGNIPASRLMLEANVSQEMMKVTENVIMTQKIAQDFQFLLKEQVDEKTQELQDLNEELIKVSQTDSLSGLYNRGAFDSLALKTYRYCQRHQKSFTLAIFDIDHFKNINDSFGHAAGDACIIDVANIIAAKCRRDTDIVARYGGEEFLLLIASDKPEHHLEHIALIHRTISLHQTSLNGHNIELTISCGVLRIINDFSKELMALISMADEQLYLSKNKGRNQINTKII